MTVDTADAARAWVDGWSRAWPVGDVELVAQLYTDDATFFSHPFRPNQDPRTYATWAFAGQRTAECRFGTPIVDGDRAAVDWWAVITAPDGSQETLAGTSLLRFDAEGRVVDQRDAWAVQSDRHELSHWAVE